MTVMTPADRTTTEKYAKALDVEFASVEAAAWSARDAGDMDLFASHVLRSRTVFCEMQGVATALRTGILPF